MSVQKLKQTTLTSFFPATAFISTPKSTKKNKIKGFSDSMEWNKRILPFPISDDEENTEKNKTDKKEINSKKSVNKRKISKFIAGESTSDENSQSPKKIAKVFADKTDNSANISKTVNKNRQLPVDIDDPGVVDGNSDSESSVSSDFDNFNDTTIVLNRSGENEASSSKIKPDPKILIIKDVILSKDKKLSESDKNEQNIDKTKSPNMDIVIKYKEFVNNVFNSENLSNLLEKNECEIMKDYISLPINYQFFILKLFLWKARFYNLFTFAQKINLDKIMTKDEIMEMYKKLTTKTDLFSTEYWLKDSYILLNTLPLKDIRDICKKFRFSQVNFKKEKLIQKLLKNCKQQETFSLKTTADILKDRIKEKMGYCLELKPYFRTILHKIYFLNVFANFDFSLPQDYFYRYRELVLPDFEVRDYCVFKTSDEFTKYLNAVTLEYELDKALENKDKIESDTQIHNICNRAFNFISEKDESNSDILHYHERFTAVDKYISVLTRGLQRILPKFYEDCLMWLQYLMELPYHRHKRFLWIVLISKIYTYYLKDYSAAAELVIQALVTEKFDFDFELQEIANRARLLLRKSYKLQQIYHDQIVDLMPAPISDKFPYKIVSCRTIRGNQPGSKRHYVIETANGRQYPNVEDVALQDYLRNGYTHGRHFEGQIISAAFNVLFWDCIYKCNVKGTFISKQQDVPLDMYTKYFYINRELEIRKRLAEIEIRWSDDDLYHFIVDVFNKHSNENSLCQFSFITNMDELFTIIMCIGRKLMSLILKRLAVNYQAYHSGFPDLLVWNPDTKKAKFVEVKGEKDKLSIKQKLWIDYLLSHEADVEICHVHSLGSTRKLEYEAL